MDYEANTEQQKRSHRLYGEFMIDILTFQKLSNEVSNSKVQDEEFKAKCKYLPKLLDQIAINASNVKNLFPSFAEIDEVTENSTHV